MTAPVVSILLPVRNEARHLTAALDSLSRQTLTEWELVAVDDHSNDETPSILVALASRDERIRVVSPTIPGLVNALNAGLAHCRSSIVARMDGDDIAHPRRLELQHRFLMQHPEVGLVTSRFRHFPRAHLRVGMLAYETWQNRLMTHEEMMRDIYVESPVVHPSVMFRKDLVDGVGGYRDMGWAEDYDLWLRLAAAGVRFARLPETLLFWRDRPERFTRTHSSCSAEAFRACKVYHLKQQFLRGTDEVTLAGAGQEGRAWYRTLAAEGIRVSRWIDVDPRKVGRMLHGAPVMGTTDVMPGEGKMLLTVGTRGARDAVRHWAIGAGFREGVDFVCVT
ncbi:MAG: glycosyltransferase [Geobacter sp.]|nr:glycosyltransferase [Geobacter sp.]